MHSTLTLSATLGALLSLVGSTQAMFSDGTISSRDSAITYSGYSDTTAFCTSFRAACINFVGNLDYHHSLDCVVSQPGPAIFAFCGGTHKTATGDFGSGTEYDFTSGVCPNVNGCTITAQPASPEPDYKTAPAGTPAAAPVASSSSDSAVVTSTPQVALASPTATSAVAPTPTTTVGPTPSINSLATDTAATTSTAVAPVDTSASSTVTVTASDSSTSSDSTSTATITASSSMITSTVLVTLTSESIGFLTPVALASSSVVLSPTTSASNSSSNTVVASSATRFLAPTMQLLLGAGVVFFAL